MIGLSCSTPIVLSRLLSQHRFRLARGFAACNANRLGWRRFPIQNGDVAKSPCPTGFDVGNAWDRGADVNTATDRYAEKICLCFWLAQVFNGVEKLIWVR